MKIKKTTQLARLIQSPELEFLMEAHSGMSAKIVEETGFKGIWASGLAISALHGLRDNNELSWSQVLDFVEFMAEGTRIPILLDADTGYGDFNTVRRLVAKCESKNIAGIALEDKHFPKKNSLLYNSPDALESIEAFCAKIKAAKDAQRDDDFVVVARTESFIAQQGLDEALKRAEAYRLAGADAIIVHSKQDTDVEIAAFMREWGKRHPIMIIPTQYAKTPTTRFAKLGVSTVIWANHSFRSSIAAMTDTIETIYKHKRVDIVEEKIASLNRVFALQDVEELETAKQKYLPDTASAQQNKTSLTSDNSLHTDDSTYEMSDQLTHPDKPPIQQT